MRDSDDNIEQPVYTNIGIKGLMAKKSINQDVKDLSIELEKNDDFLSEEDILREMKEMDALIQDMKNTRYEISFEKSKRIKDNNKNYMDYAYEIGDSGNRKANLYSLLTFDELS